MNSLLVAPHNLFQLIEMSVTARPELLKAFHWHELASGKEAFVEDQILDEDTAHCLAGWIVSLTPNAARFERIRQDVDTYANEILVNSGRKPIPVAIFNGEEEDMLKVIRMRARAEEKEGKTCQTK